MAPALEHTIEHRPEFALLRVQLSEGQQVFAEPSAMASMDPTIHMLAGFKGGFQKTLGRAFGGESMIVNTFTAQSGAGEVTFAPGAMGDLVHHALDGSCGLLLERGAYVASSEGVEISGKWQGMRGFFSGEGLVLLRATGSGDLWFNTYGAILEIDVRDGYVVDNQYVVAFEETLDYTISTVSGLGVGAGPKLKGLFFGEGFVCRFSGQGRLWIQTRAVRPFLNWVLPFRPVKDRG